jgi:hypothetical protein
MAPAEDEQSAPRVTVVVPTRDREARLAFALEALAAQTIDPREFEVIVVRDGDDRGWRTPPPPGLRVETLTMPGHPTPTEKRNGAWRRARGDLIAFTDDDCRPSPRWLESLLGTWEAGGRPRLALLHGPIEPDPDELPLLTGLARSLVSDRHSRWFPTANLALTRDLLTRLEGFDESFRWAGEDTDLGLRALEGGAVPLYAEGGLVWHAVHSRTLAGALREARRAGDVAPLFVRHPQQRRQIFARVFWKRSHAAAGLAALGIAAALGGRRLTGAVAVAPFVIVNYDSSVDPGPKHLMATALHLPVRLAVDLAETAATVRGAIRSRTVVV